MPGLYIDARHCVIRDDSVTTLDQIRNDGIGLAIWQRPASAIPQRARYALHQMPNHSSVTEDRPETAARALQADLPVAARPLAQDIRFLARRFANIAGIADVRIRLQLVKDDACRKFHVDAVGLRMLCTYAGPGTEWVDADGQVRILGLMQVAIFKGRAFPDQTPRVLHRSPALSRRPPRQRERLVLCIDDPAYFR